MWPPAGPAWPLVSPRWGRLPHGGAAAVTGAGMTGSVPANADTSQVAAFPAIEGLLDDGDAPLATWAGWSLSELAQDLVLSCPEFLCRLLCCSSDSDPDSCPDS